MRLPVILIATFFGVGYIPFIPATWASALAAVLTWYVTTPAFFWASLGVFLVTSLWACRPSQGIFNSNDPKQFVMDEVCGMMIALIGIPRDIRWYIAGFLLFRLFDAWKPGPIRRIQDHSHPTSIVWDDVAAGVVANILLQVALRLF